jgi:hypothetical protein
MIFMANVANRKNKFKLRKKKNQGSSVVEPVPANGNALKYDQIDYENGASKMSGHSSSGANSSGTLLLKMKHFDNV